MRKNKFLTVYACLVFGFLPLPLAIIAVTAFNTAPTISFPISGFTFKWFANVFATKSFLSGFQLSFMLAIVATLIALLVGVPAAYALCRNSVKGKKLLKSFLIPDDHSGHRRRLFVISVHRSEAEAAGHAGLTDRSLPGRAALCHPGCRFRAGTI